MLVFQFGSIKYTVRNGKVTPSGRFARRIETLISLEDSPNKELTTIEGLGFEIIEHTPDRPLPEETLF